MKIVHLGNGIVMIRNLIERGNFDEGELLSIPGTKIPQGYSIVDGK